MIIIIMDQQAIIAATLMIVHFSEIIKSTVKKLGSLDILINNAGITRDSLLLRLSEENWDMVLNTNLKATFQSIIFL